MSILDSTTSIFGKKKTPKVGLLGKKKQPKDKEDAAIQALFQNWLTNPTNQYHLKAFAEGMVEWEIKAHMKKLPEVTQ